MKRKTRVVMSHNSFLLFFPFPSKLPVKMALPNIIRTTEWLDLKIFQFSIAFVEQMPNPHPFAARQCPTQLISSHSLPEMAWVPTAQPSQTVAYTDFAYIL